MKNDARYSYSLLHLAIMLSCTLLGACKYEAVEQSAAQVNDANTSQPAEADFQLPLCDGECTCDEVSIAFNDTGSQLAGDFPAGNFASCNNQSGFLQDCDIGADATQNQDLDGHAGFSFTKLDNAGNRINDMNETASCVLDNVTGLIWEVKTFAGSGGLQDANHTYTWRDDNFGAFSSINGGDCDRDCDSQSYLARLNQQALCGYNDWRLPSKIELQEIVNYHTNTPAIDSNFFPHTKTAFYWSNTLDVDDEGSVWAVDFNVGRVAGGVSSTTRHIRAVRGVDRILQQLQPPTNEEQEIESRRRYAPQQRCNAIEANTAPTIRYKQDQNGNVLDTLTGLIWQKCVVGLSGENCEQGEAEKLDWQQAFEYANTLNDNTPNAQPWRLPSIKELQQNIELACEEPPLNPFAFKNIPFGEVWSATPNPRNDDASYHYQYQNSIVFYSSRQTKHHVHLVRSCQSTF